MTGPRARGWLLAALTTALAVACASVQAPPRPDDACAAECGRRIPRCGQVGCTRGCTLALDRLLEGEAPTVLACVEASRAACDDWLWADCAARVGPHADGGPPPPVPGPRR